MALNDRQQEIVHFLMQTPGQAMSVSQLPKQGVARTTTFRDIGGLVAMKILVAEGPTKARTYHINPESSEYLEWDLSRPPEQRSHAPFNAHFLGDYTPNKSSFLSKDQKTRMAKAASLVAGQTPPSGKPYERMLSRLLIDLTHASSNLENIPISWLDTKTLIEFGERPAGLDDTQLKIVLNHRKAIGFLIENVRDLRVSHRDVMALHSLLAEGLISNRKAIGQFRSQVVRFDDSRYMPPDNPHVLREAFADFCVKAEAIKDPFEQSFFIMTGMPYLQPFQDANKRTSRLVMNIPLIKRRLPPFSFSDMRKRDYMLGLLAVYERNKTSILAESFVSAYEKTAPRYMEFLNYIQSGGLLKTVSQK